MRTLIKVQSKGQMTIPRRVRSAVGLADGDLVEVKAVGKKIVITPQLVDDDEYSPAQRCAIDARLAKSDEDIKHGRVHGPYDSHKGFVESLRQEMAKLAGKKTNRNSK